MCCLKEMKHGIMRGRQEKCAVCMWPAGVERAGREDGSCALFGRYGPRDMCGVKDICMWEKKKSDVCVCNLHSIEFLLYSYVGVINGGCMSFFFFAGRTPFSCTCL